MREHPRYKSKKLVKSEKPGKKSVDNIVYVEYAQRQYSYTQLQIPSQAPNTVHRWKHYFSR